MSEIEDLVCKKIMMRSAKGESKYGVTMEREDLNMLEWLTHLQEELMDATVYVQKLINMVVAQDE
tara:strand:- start:234 stop:428 length:195 start_codon:yes stop_codon:yes gene_type:complete